MKNIRLNFEKLDPNFLYDKFTKLNLVNLVNFSKQIFKNILPKLVVKELVADLSIINKNLKPSLFNYAQFLCVYAKYLNYYSLLLQAKKKKIKNLMILLNAYSNQFKRLSLYKRMFVLSNK